MRFLVVLACLAVCMIQFGAVQQAAAGPGSFIRTVSAPPKTAVNDLRFSDTVEQQLNWTYYCCGDYDQNGEVNISDVTVIGQNFGHTTANLDWHKARVADGDGNGEVNIADITPIGNNFGSHVTHFLLYTATTQTGPFEVAGADQPITHATTEFLSAPIPAGGGPREFRHVIAYPVPGRYYAVVACDGSTAAEVHSNVLQFDPMNLPPVASFASYPGGERMVGVAVRLDAGASTDPDGTIVKYEWDTLGDGNWLESGTDTVFQYQYLLPGAYAPALRVTDNEGATCMTSFDEPQLYVSAGVIHTSVIDSDPQAGIQLSCALIDELPAIAYVQYDGDYELRYLRASGTDPLTWPDPVLVDVGASQPSLADLLGLPAIAYSKDELNYILANDPDGDSWILPVSVASDPDPFATRGYQPHLIAGTGEPLIADSTFQPTLPGEVWVSQSADGLGAIWGMESQISEPGLVGYMTSLAAFDGAFVSIVYQRFINSNTYDIHYRSSLSDDITLGWYQLCKFSPENARLSTDCSMIAADPAWGGPQLPLIAYWSVDDRLMRSVSATERDDLEILIFADIAESTGTNANFSLAKIDVQPAVAFFDGASHELKLSWASDRMAFDWADPIVLDSGAEFRNPSLIDFNNWPAVAYYDADAQVLKFCYVAPE